MSKEVSLYGKRGNHDDTLIVFALKDPTDFSPTFHVFYLGKLPWLQLNGDLVKYDGSVRFLHGLLSGENP